MPYKTDGSDVPDSVAQRSAVKRRQWAAVWNSAYAKCQADGGDDCEGRAFAQANAVIAQEAAALKQYQYNGVKVRASARRASTRADKKYMRDVDAGDGATRVVHYGDPGLPMQRDVPDRRENFLARHNCASKRDPFAPGFWACYDWQNTNEEGSMPELEPEITEDMQVEATAPDPAPEAVMEDAPPEALPGDEPESEVAEMPNPTPAAAPAARAVAAAVEHLQAALAALAALSADAPEDMPDAMPDTEPAMASETFAETAVLALQEAEPPTNRRAPLRLDVGIIKVGPGNQRDNHYYTREMLERDGGLFEGVKMYATDHRNDEKSVRTEVSMVEKVLGVREFAEGEYLVGRAIVFNPDFAEDVRNRAEAGVLGSLHCSILASGEAAPGRVGEKEYNIVSRITEAQSVDWVTRAGAGGHALGLSEAAAAPEPAPEPEDLTEAHPAKVTLSEDAPAVTTLPIGEVLAALGNTNLPAASVAELGGRTYAAFSEVEAAITAEVARLKAAGSGQPLGGRAAPPPTPVNPAQIVKEQASINSKWLGR